MNSKNVIKGAVFENHDGHLHPLLGSNLYLVNEKRGISTDQDGKFEFSLKNKSETIIVSYVGYKSDTIVVDRYHEAVSYTHLRAHETVLDLVCRLLLEKKKQ